MDEIQASGECLLITKHGKPLVKLVPAGARDPADDRIFGYMSGKAKIVGDILAPATPTEDWST